MPALNFQKQFADAVESGLFDLRGEPRPDRLIGVRPKLQTIRLYRKDERDPKPGQTLYHFTGMRTKQCRRLGEAECTSVMPVEIGWSTLRYSFGDTHSSTIVPRGGSLIDRHVGNNFARDD